MAKLMLNFLAAVLSLSMSSLAHAKGDVEPLDFSDPPRGEQERDPLVQELNRPASLLHFFKKKTKPLKKVDLETEENVTVAQLQGTLEPNSHDRRREASRRADEIFTQTKTATSGNTNSGAARE